MDGINKFLVKADVAAVIKHKERDALEKLLKEGWESVNDQIAKKVITAAHGYAVFGKMCLRAVCTALKKKSDIEAAEFKSFAEIKLKFDDDIKAPARASQSVSAPKAKDATIKVMTAADSCSVKVIAANQGFKVGSLYMLKIDDTTKKLVKPFDMDEKAGVTFKSVDMFQKVEDVYFLKFDELKKKASPYAGKAPALIDDSFIKKRTHEDNDYV